MIQVHTDMPAVMVDAVQEAAERLGITKPLHIVRDFTLGFFSCGGAYRGFTDELRLFGSVYPLDEPRHIIALLDDEPRSNETLWHEMAHALQCERDCELDIKRLIDKTNAYLRAHGLYEKFTSTGGVTDAEREIYEALPHEQEAIQVAIANRHIPLLASADQGGFLVTEKPCDSHDYPLETIEVPLPQRHEFEVVADLDEDTYQAVTDPAT